MYGSGKVSSVVKVIPLCREVVSAAFMINRNIDLLFQVTFAGTLKVIFNAKFWQPFKQ